MVLRADFRHLLEHKRAGLPLTENELGEFVQGLVAGVVDPAQSGALLMACAIRGINRTETLALTRAMVASGESLNLDFPGGAVDKHSSGGVGDTGSIVAVPILAACGVTVAKLSGRALGHTGGTLDKLESIQGFQTALSSKRFIECVRSVGCAIAAQSSTLAPADKIIYALRDATSTIDEIGLITASIVSKKIAGGAQDILFDVKVGSGAFMKDIHAATNLAHSLVDVVRAFGRRSAALITDMNEPVSARIGTGLEIISAREFLRGERADTRLSHLVSALCGEVLNIRAIQNPAARVQKVLSSGAAYEKFCEMIEAQGGSVSDMERLEASSNRTTILAPRAGYVRGVRTDALGLTARFLTERYGRQAGLEVQATIGQRVGVEQPLLTVYAPSDDLPQLSSYFEIGDEAPAERPLLVDRIVN